MRIAVIGNGRMARMLDAVCAQEDGFDVAGIVEQGACASLEEIAEADAVVDFSHPDMLNEALSCAVRRHMPLVLGTTGLSAEQEDAVRAASDTIPIVWSNNFSVGVTVLTHLVRTAARMLGDGFDAEICEIHHRLKADAPSGTAYMLLGALDPQGCCRVVHGREGRTAGRSGQIGVHALRGGTMAGEHSVRFFGPMEELELRHRADSREIFARGALRAAEFAAGAKPGLYGMDDVLFGGL